MLFLECREHVYDALKCCLHKPLARFWNRASRPWMFYFISWIGFLFCFALLNPDPFYIKHLLWMNLWLFTLRHIWFRSRYFSTLSNWPVRGLHLRGRHEARRLQGSQIREAARREAQSGCGESGQHLGLPSVQTTRGWVPKRVSDSTDKESSQHSLTLMSLQTLTTVLFLETQAKGLFSISVYKQKYTKYMFGSD